VRFRDIQPSEGYWPEYKLQNQEMEQMDQRCRSVATLEINKLLNLKSIPLRPAQYQSYRRLYKEDNEHAFRDGWHLRGQESYYPSGDQSERRKGPLHLQQTVRQTTDELSDTGAAINSLPCTVIDDCVFPCLFRKGKHRQSPFNFPVKLARIQHEALIDSGVDISTIRTSILETIPTSAIH